MIEFAVDVNFVLDAARFKDSYTEALNAPNARMQLLIAVARQGRELGVVLHTGPHVINNIRRALRSQDISYRSVTREAWSEEDIKKFIGLFLTAVVASGGRSDVGTVTHDQALGLFRAAGAPDAEDYQMLFLAVSSGATVLATMDDKLLLMREFQGMEIWVSDEIHAEVKANHRRLQRQGRN